MGCAGMLMVALGSFSGGIAIDVGGGVPWAAVAGIGIAVVVVAVAVATSALRVPADVPAD